MNKRKYLLILVDADCRVLIVLFWLAVFRLDDTSFSGRLGTTFGFFGALFPFGLMAPFLFFGILFFSRAFDSHFFFTIDLIKFEFFCFKSLSFFYLFRFVLEKLVCFMLCTV